MSGNHETDRMNTRISGIAGLFLGGIIGLGTISCTSRAVSTGMLVATEVPANSYHKGQLENDLWRYIPGARIVAFLPGKPGRVRVLTGGFSSAAFPEISYDGKKMLFAAQKKQDETWQIWEMDLETLKSRKITSSAGNCTDPVYLPDGRLAFSRLTANDTVSEAHCLFTCSQSGSEMRQITFSPASIFVSTVMKDGRLLAVCLQQQSGSIDRFIMVLRPDGTKADLFYRGPEGSTVTGRICETTDGKLVFAESRAGEGQFQNLTSIKYNRPLYTRDNITMGIEGDFCTALPMDADRYIVSGRSNRSSPYSLFDFDPVHKSLGKEILSEPGYDIIDVAEVMEKELPRKLPSEVDRQVKTGLLLCQDINFMYGIGSQKLPGRVKADWIEITGIDTTYGKVKVEEDGSFYLKVMADTPFRIRSIDEKGNTVSGPCTWLWLRPNERRGCVGCHEDPELAPDNRVALAVHKQPVIVPVHITEIREKIVELE